MTMLIQPLPPWTRNLEGSSHINPAIKSPPLTADGRRLTFGSKRVKSPTRKTDRIFGAILSTCVVVMIGSGIAWACGWEHGPYLLVIAGGLANVPMFHFAMHWPFRDKGNPDKPS